MSSRSFREPASAWQRWLLVLVLLGAGLHALRPLWNVDLFWHLSSGRIFLAQGSLPEHDPLTYTAGERPWVHHEWLSQVVLALVVDTVGLGGSRFVRAVLVVSGLGALWWLARRRLGPTMALAVLVVGWLGLLPNASLRPHLVAWPLAVAVLAGLLPRIFDFSPATAGPASRRPASLIAYLALAAAVLLWVNLHSSAVVVPLLCAVAAAGATLDRWWGGLDSWRTARVATSAAAVTALACCAQPAGLELAGYVVETPAVNVRSAEWAVLLSLGTWNAFPWVLVGWLGLTASVLLCGFLERRGQRLSSAFPGFWVAAACLALAAEHRRMTLFFFLPAFYVALQSAPALRAGFERWAARSEGRSRDVLVRAAVGVALALATTSLLGAVPEALETAPLRRGLFPERAADVMAAADLRGHLFHDINWGGYLGFRRFPAQQVYADGRWLLAGEQALFDYPRLYRRGGSPSDVAALYAAYAIEVVVLPTRDVLHLPALDEKAWRLAFVDEIATVLIHRGPTFDANRQNLCAFYQQSPALLERARWPVAVKRPDDGPSPTDIPSILVDCTL